MPRPNRQRSIRVEATLADRIGYERDERGMTYEGLAKRMTDLGCPIQPSALYKIEKGTPRRRITVDELVGLSLALQVPIPDLLLDAQAVEDLRFRELLAKAAQTYHNYVVQLVGYTSQREELARLCAAPDAGPARLEALREHLAEAERAAGLDATSDGAEPVDSITVGYLRDVVEAAEAATRPRRKKATKR